MDDEELQDWERRCEKADEREFPEYRELKELRIERRMLRRQLIAHLCNCSGQEIDENTHAFRCPYRLVMNGIANAIYDTLTR